jgi:hypothetical protein
MWMTTVAVERSQVVAATAEQAWSLLSSPAVWSLMAGSFAMDATPATPATGRPRIVMYAHHGHVHCRVSEVSEDRAGQMMSLRRLDQPPDSEPELTLSVVSGRGGVKAVMCVRGTIQREGKLDFRATWRKQLDAWLGVCRSVLEGRTPWPDLGIPDDVRAACTRRRVLEDAVSVSATALISAPPVQVWETVWDPATSRVISLECVAAGQVPGTPSRQVGEIQYFVHQPPGHPPDVHLLVVHELADGHRALVQSINGPENETLHLVEPEAGGTRLTLTSRYPGRAVNGNHELFRSNLAQQVARYKSLLEEPG